MQSSDWTHLAHTEWLYTSTAPHHGQLVSSGRYRTCGRVPNMRGGFIVASPFDRPDRVAAPTTGALFHACCRFCRACFFPLDEELELLPGELSATLAEGVARLGTKLPFEQAAADVAFFWRVELDETTVRRYTQAAGTAYVAEQADEVERLERERPATPAGPTVQYLSADGAMVPLVGGQWAEVKTLAIGEVEVRPA